MEIGIGILLLAAFWFWLGYDSGYKKGQVDAITGKICYKKVIHENQTVTWVKMEWK